MSYPFVESPLARTSHSITPPCQARKAQLLNLYVLPSSIKREAWVFDAGLQPPPWNATCI